MYTLKALRVICASLGFKEVSEPSYEKEDDCGSPVVQTFDTLNEGLVTFRLYLHNKIESDSGIDVEVCRDEFEKLSKLLKDKYGVDTSFRRIGQEAAPQRLSKTEKPMPQQEKRVDNRRMSR